MSLWKITWLLSFHEALWGLRRLLACYEQESHRSTEQTIKWSTWVHWNSGPCSPFSNINKIKIWETVKNQIMRDFPGGPVVKNPPANAGDTGSIPGPGRFHMPLSNWARAPHVLSLCSRAWESQQGRPLQWEDHAPQRRVALARYNQRKAARSYKVIYINKQIKTHPFSQLNWQTFIGYQLWTNS